MSNNTNFNPGQKRGHATGKSRFAEHVPTTNELPPLLHDVVPVNRDAERYVVLAAQYDEGPGSDPGFWRRQDDLSKLASAPATHELTELERKGWDSANSLLSVIASQESDVARATIVSNLAIARNTQTIYRIAGLTERQPRITEYWDARAERLGSILDGLDDADHFDSEASAA